MSNFKTETGQNLDRDFHSKFQETTHLRLIESDLNMLRNLESDPTNCGKFNKLFTGADMLIKVAQLINDQSGIYIHTAIKNSFFEIHNGSTSVHDGNCLSIPKEFRSS